MQTGIPPTIKDENIAPIDLTTMTDGHSKIRSTISNCRGICVAESTISPVIMQITDSYGQFDYFEYNEQITPGQMLKFILPELVLNATIYPDGFISTNTVNYDIHVRPVLEAINFYPNAKQFYIWYRFEFSLEPKNHSFKSLSQAGIFFRANLVGVTTLNINNKFMVYFNTNPIPRAMTLEELENPLPYKPTLWSTTSQERNTNGLIDLTTQQREGRVSSNSRPTSRLRYLFKRLKNRRKEM